MVLGLRGICGRNGRDGNKGDKGICGYRGFKGDKGEIGKSLVSSNTNIIFGSSNLGNLIGDHNRSFEFDEGLMFPGYYDGMYNYYHKINNSYWNNDNNLSSGFCLANIKNIVNLDNSNNSSLPFVTLNKNSILKKISFYSCNLLKHDKPTISIAIIKKNNNNYTYYGNKGKGNLSSIALDNINKKSYIIPMVDESNDPVNQLYLLDINNKQSGTIDVDNLIFKKNESVGIYIRVNSLISDKIKNIKSFILSLYFEDINIKHYNQLEITNIDKSNKIYNLTGSLKIPYGEIKLEKILLLNILDTFENNKIRSLLIHYNDNMLNKKKNINSLDNYDKLVIDTELKNIISKYTSLDTDIHLYILNNSLDIEKKLQYSIFNRFKLLNGFRIFDGILKLMIKNNIKKFKIKLFIKFSFLRYLDEKAIYNLSIEFIDFFDYNNFIMNNDFEILDLKLLNLLKDDFKPMKNIVNPSMFTINNINNINNKYNKKIYNKINNKLHLVLNNILLQFHIFLPCYNRNNIKKNPSDFIQCIGIYKILNSFNKIDNKLQCNINFIKFIGNDTNFSL